MAFIVFIWPPLNAYSTKPAFEPRATKGKSYAFLQQDNVLCLLHLSSASYGMIFYISNNYMDVLNNPEKLSKKPRFAILSL